MWSARFVAVLALPSVLAGGALAATPPEFPNKPIRYIVATGPGGASDLIGRTLGPPLSEALGVQVVIDNRSGAGNTVGAEIAARAAPDGYTLFSCNIASLAVGPALYKKLGYDPERDFAPLGMIVSNPNVFTVHPSLPARSIAQFIALAKANPGKLNYGSSGVGFADHLAGELFNTLAGVKMQHVPYKGGTPAMIDLLGGNVQLIFATVSTALTHIKAGKIRPLAVTFAKRAEQFPDWPTVAESGVPGFSVDNWYGFMAPRGAPKPVIGKLHREIGRVLEQPDVRERLAGLGIFPFLAPTPEAFGDYIKAEIKKYGKVVQESGVRAE